MAQVLCGEATGLLDVERGEIFWVRKPLMRHDMVLSPSFFQRSLAAHGFCKLCFTHGFAGLLPGTVQRPSSCESAGEEGVGGVLGAFTLNLPTSCCISHSHPSYGGGGYT